MDDTEKKNTKNRERCEVGEEMEGRKDREMEEEQRRIQRGREGCKN